MSLNLILEGQYFVQHLILMLWVSWFDLYWSLCFTTNNHREKKYILWIQR